MPALLEQPPGETLDYRKIERTACSVRVASAAKLPCYQVAERGDRPERELPVFTDDHFDIGLSLATDEMRSLARVAVERSECNPVPAAKNGCMLKGPAASSRPSRL